MGEEDLGNYRSYWEFYLLLWMLWGTTVGFEHRNKTDFVFLKNRVTLHAMSRITPKFLAWKTGRRKIHHPTSFSDCICKTSASIHFYSSVLWLQPNRHHFLSNLKQYHHKWFSIIRSPLSQSVWQKLGGSLKPMKPCSGLPTDLECNLTPYGLQGLTLFCHSLSSISFLWLSDTF